MIAFDPSMIDKNGSSFVHRYVSAHGKGHAYCLVPPSFVGAVGDELKLLCHDSFSCHTGNSALLIRVSIVHKILIACYTDINQPRQ